MDEGCNRREGAQSTDIANTDPSCAKPYADIELPTRPNERTDNEPPRCKKSSTDIVNIDPN